MNKIFCVGDGYAHGHIWPEWPQILQALTPSHEIHVISGVGAGNEYLVTELLALEKDIQNQIVIFQWAHHKRFDKLIEDSDWEQIAKSDPIYHFNFNNCDDRLWWLSSASGNQKVQLYHDIVQEKQSCLRTKTYKTLMANYLQNQGCSFYFTSTQDQHNYANHPRVSSIRGNQVQPSPLSHLYFLREIIIPNLPIVISAQRIETLEQRIKQQTWLPCDPDRDEIWRKITQF